MAKKSGGVAAASSGIENLLYQVLETELGGVQVYNKALECVQNEDLKEEWEKYLEETERHVQIARSLLEAFGLDPDEEHPARMPVRTIGEALVQAMDLALEAGDPVAAQLTAADCVVEAETKDHHDWELVGMLAEKTKGEKGKALKEAYEQVEKEEDHHVYHSTGWARELWIEALGLPAVLPPPEEEKDVETAIGAARAKNARDDML
jgi:hypothetical protein